MSEQVERRRVEPDDLPGILEQTQARHARYKGDGLTGAMYDIEGALWNAGFTGPHGGPTPKGALKASRWCVSLLGQSGPDPAGMR